MTEAGTTPSATQRPTDEHAPAAPWLTDEDADTLCARWRERRPHYLHLFAGDVLTLDVARAALEMQFDVGPQWGHVLGLQGGIVAGMLDSVMAQCVILCSGFTLGPPTLELKVSFLAPARPGAFIARGTVEHGGRSIAFARGELRDARGALVATATATARLVPRDPAAPL